jgi:hypothetical protein
MFGFPRLRALIGEHGEESSLEDLLPEELHSFVGEGWQQEDDITLLTLHAPHPKLNFGELRIVEVRRIPLPRTAVNRASSGAWELPKWHHTFRT